MIATQFSTEVWVNFKVFGALIATSVVALVQTCCLSMVPPEEYDHSAEDLEKRAQEEAWARAYEEVEVNMEEEESIGGQDDIELLPPRHRRQ